MQFVSPDLVPAIPEMFVLGMTCVLILTSVMVKQHKEAISYLLAQVTLIGACVLSILMYHHAKEITFHGSFIMDHLANLLKIFIYGSCFFVFLYSREYLKERKIPYAEYYILSLFSVIGMMVLVSAYSFVSLYLGLELMSLPLYALIAIQRDDKEGAEAAIKYFVMGAVASGMLLYGLSMIYGATKSLDITVVSQAISAIPPSENLILVFGLVFAVVGIAFKLGSVPFHMWVPDIYDGAPNSVTVFVATAPKLAAFGLAIRLLVDMMPLYHDQWQQMLTVIAVLSIALGNVVAIVQTNIKRMLAYSAIAHMGYTFLGLIAGTDFGYTGSLFYMLMYTIMSLGAFGLLVLMSRAGIDVENIEDLKGLNDRNPWMAFMMLLVMFSMAGIPPSAGFFAKLSVLSALVQSHIVWLAVYAMIFAIVGAFYYLRVVKTMYFDSPDEQASFELKSFDMRLAFSINGLIVLVVGVFPGIIFSLCQAAF